MLAASVPTNFQIPFANSAGGSYIRTIPVASQIGITPGAASLTDGFPPLNFTPIAGGGVPFSGLDVNGIFKQITANIQWWGAGGYPQYNSAFSTAIGGYPNGSVIQAASFAGFWRSTADNNTSNPETGGANWVPVSFIGTAAVTMTSANVTLTLAQYAMPIIVITGTLTANVQLIFPNIVGEWLIVNNTTGAFTITAKTAAGTGTNIPNGEFGVYGDGTNISDATISQSAADNRYATEFFSLTASVAANALTVTTGTGPITFRNSTLTTGTPIPVVITSGLSLTVPSGATLGTVNAVAARLVWLVAYNAGTPVLCVVNLAGGLQLDETNLISPTTISAGATSAGVIYSASAVGANSPYRVIGFTDITEATAGTWATAPSTVQPAGGTAISAMGSLGYGQTWQDVTASRAIGTTYYNTTGKPIMVAFTGFAAGAITFVMTINGSAVNFGWATGSVNGSGVVVIPAGASYVLSNPTTKTLWQELR
jgi:hypothetical protein